jgi:K+-sensing histidine kinase KdpD
VDGRVNVAGAVELLLHQQWPPYPANQWERIFEKFTTAEHGETQKNFGLGLWGLKTFFKRQGGDVFIAASDAENDVSVCKSGPRRWRE